MRCALKINNKSMHWNAFFNAFLKIIKFESTALMYLASEIFKNAK